jgi:hypothetical protein
VRFVSIGPADVRTVEPASWSGCRCAARALLEAGLHLTGIAMVMDLQDENTQLRAENAEVGRDLQHPLRVPHAV